jgi:hypothetical protein
MGMSTIQKLLIAASLSVFLLAGCQKSEEDKVAAALEELMECRKSDTCSVRELEANIIARLSPTELEKLKLAAQQVGLEESKCREFHRCTEAQVLAILSPADREKLKKYKLGDWLHDIDMANTVVRLAGRSTPDPKFLSLPRDALNLAYKGEPQDCWPPANPRFPNIGKLLDSAHTDHACLDAHGYKRNQ